MARQTERQKLDKLLDDLEKHTPEVSDAGIIEFTGEELSPPPEVAADIKKLDLAGQAYQHRDKLLRLVIGLSLAGFILLFIVTLMQMIVRLWEPQYTGISDTALNILAVSVFGEVIAVVAVIVRLVWKQSEK